MTNIQMSSNNPKNNRPFGTPQEAQGRHSIRLPEYDYSLPGVYYITMCVRDRRCVLGDVTEGAVRLSRYGEIVNRWWRILPERFPGIALDEYVIMPNHVHGLVDIIGDCDTTNGIVPHGVGAIHELPLLKQRRAQRRGMLLPKIIGYFKMSSAKQINHLAGLTGQPFWQRNYWEHIGRNDQSIRRIREYIRSNPLNWASDEENPKCSGRMGFCFLGASWPKGLGG